MTSHPTPRSIVVGALYSRGIGLSWCAEMAGAILKAIDDYGYIFTLAAAEQPAENTVQHQPSSVQ